MGSSKEYVWALRDLYIEDLDIDGSRRGVRYKTVKTALAAARKASTRQSEVVMIEIYKLPIGAECLDQGILVYSTPSGPTPEELDIRIPDRRGVFSWIVRDVETGKNVKSGSSYESVRDAIWHAKSARRSLMPYQCGEAVYEIYENGKLIHVQDEYHHNLSDMDAGDLDYDQKHSLDRLITAIEKSQDTTLGLK